MPTRKKTRTQWYRVDLHLHTPASSDYLDPNAGYIDILRKAEQRSIDIIAFTDHNTVSGYSAMLHEIDQLSYLQKLERANADELRLLAEYRRLLDKILVLPGFEFTATFGFHILGLFSPQTPIRLIEHLLLTLNVPVSVLESGSSEVGASSDVLTAYRAINEAGGVCIAAHANASNGVAMTGIDFGGQTRIAYTQDRHLHALEVTDLSKRDRRSTQKFFDGTKPEYPRRMRCIQGSDAHALTTFRDKTGRVITLGVGERVTELALTERSFEALLELFQNSDFSQSRAYNPNRQPEDFVQLARDEGESIIQSFHAEADQDGIIRDVCAFANTNGGTIYVGVSLDKKKKIAGIDNAKDMAEIIRHAVSTMITPALYVEIDILESGGKNVIRLQVPYSEDRPYAIENQKIYVRDEAETTLAVRDEIVNLVRQGMIFKQSPRSSTTQNSGYYTGYDAYDPNPDPVNPSSSVTTMPPPLNIVNIPPENTTIITSITPPRAGVEIVDVELREGKTYYTMHDLRNGNIVRNVTLSSARRLWHYAVKQKESSPLRAEQVQWAGDIGLWRRYKKGGDVRYDLVQRDGERIRVYYGVTENGMHNDWAQFLEVDEKG